MMKWVFSLLIIFSVIFGLIFGRMDEVSNAAITQCGEAVTLTFSLMGTMCLWSGLMKIADKAQLTQRLSKLFSPFISRLFNGLDYKSTAAKAISLNITANLLGLGNAATPFGIAAMQALKKPHENFANNNMIVFVVLNTASLQLVPTTVALLRTTHNSADPLDIMPAVWLASLISVSSGVFAAKLFGILGNKKGGNRL